MLNHSAGAAKLLQVPSPVERRVGRIREWSCHVSKANLLTQGGIHIVWMVESQAQLGGKGV